MEGTDWGQGRERFEAQVWERVGGWGMGMGGRPARRMIGHHGRTKSNIYIENIENIENIESIESIESIEKIKIH